MACISLRDVQNRRAERQRSMQERHGVERFAKIAYLGRAFGAVWMWQAERGLLASGASPPEEEEVSLLLV